MFFSPRSIAALLLLATASCKTAELRHVEACVAPLDFVAWICADAARAEFPGADPLPYHSMAPMTLREDGSWAVRYELRRDGRWAARSEGRLLVDAPADDGSLPVRADYERSEGIRGWRACDEEFELTVRQGARGIEVQCQGGEGSESARRHVEAAAAFARQLADTHQSEPIPCCAQHAPWRAQSHLRLAAQLHLRGDWVAARSALARARADAPDRHALALAIAMMDRQLGQDELAARSLAAVAHATPDPWVRAAADEAGRASRSRVEGPEGDTLRLAAAASLDQGNLTSAGALLLAARTAAPDPIADLALRHRLQSQRHDQRGALGTALLLREYGATMEGDRLLASALRETGQATLARRAQSRADLAPLATTTRARPVITSKLLAEALRANESLPAAPAR